MHTGSESPAATRARAEAARWAELAATWDAASFPLVWADVPPLETAVIPGADVAADLERRGSAWGFSFGDGELAQLAWFAAGLAQAEADAWGDAGAGPVATRAFAERRFFLADRVLPWLVPWFDAVGRCYPETRDTAHRGRDWLLGVGDEMRPAPAMTGTEGMSLPGHDGYGPRDVGSVLERVASLWGGSVILRRTAASISGHEFADRAEAIEGIVASHSAELAMLYEAAAGRWRRLAEDHPGTAAYWRDLAVRATVTARELVP